LLVGAAFFLFIAVIGFVRGFKLKETAYCINGVVCVLLSSWLLLMSFGQFVIGIGCFIAGAIIGLANYSKTMAASSREATNQQVQTDLSKPLNISEIFQWSAWFKIAAHYGICKTLLFYVLFNLAFIWIIPAILLLLNVASTSFVTLLSIIMTVSVLVSSLAIFNQQVIKNLKTKQ